MRPACAPPMRLRASGPPCIEAARRAPACLHFGGDGETFSPAFLPMRLLLWVLLAGLFAAVALPAGRSAAVTAPATARPATPAELALLTERLHATADDLPRWAYTEHRIVRDDKGRVKSEQLVRYDPSQPYAEQWTPLKIDGKDPTERERARFRRRGEESAPGQPQPKSRRRPTLGESVDVARASVADETPTHLVFELPLLKSGGDRFPPEKFLVLARLKKDGGVLENVAVRLRESFRSKLVVKVKAGEASIDFAAVDPKHPPTMTTVTGDAAWSIFFIGGGGSLELRRTELKRVRPFDERFEVQIGTLKAIDF